VVERLPAVLSVGDLPRIALGDDLVYRPIARGLGISAFGVNAYTGDAPGDEVIETHDELGDGSGRHEELYVVMTGRAEFELDGETHDAPAGTLVFARPEQRRGAKAAEPDTTILVIGGKPGAAGPPSPFEYWYLAEPAYRAKDYDRAYEIAAEGLKHHAGNGPLHYQLGCYRALAGRREEALEHLRTALTLSPEKVRRWAADDSDIDSVREELGL
jgi:tetratricopeptide (TPR) repeat protein